jgi:hypothetical protein
MDKEGYKTVNDESKDENTNLLPDINAHKQKVVNNILDSEEEDEMTFKEFQLNRAKSGAKSVTNFNQDILPPPGADKIDLALSAK